MTRLRLFDIDPWLIKSNHLDKENRRLQESLTSLGNGYMGIRGNFEESYSGDHHQGSYIGGVWYPDKTRVGWWKIGYPEYFGKVINSINYLKTRLFIDGEEIDAYTDILQNFHIELDMREGIFRRSYQVNKNGKTIQLKFERFLSLETKELAAIQISLSSNKDFELKILSSLDANVRNEDANYEEMFWQPVEQNNQGLVVKTIPNNFGVEQFSVATQASFITKLHRGSSLVSPLEIIHPFTGLVKAGQEIDFTKLVIVTTSRDYAKGDLLPAGQDIINKKLSNKDFTSLKTSHSNLWEKRWNHADIIIEGSDEAQQGIRYNIFQLFSTYFGEDARLNIGPKGFTGEKYGGATYWDTEAFVLPMYLAIAPEEVSRNLLTYRYNQLDGARHNARQQGLPGALYPMVTFNGIECHNEWEITFMEIHRNAAIAHAIFNYTIYTGDENYLEQQGLTVLSEISRFWAGRVHFSERNQSYMIHGVTGPNEFENNVNNNWFTNYMAAWTLRFTLNSLEKYPKRIDELGLNKDDLNYWQDIVDRMYYPYDEDLEIFVQHDTFLDKKFVAAKDLDPDNLPLTQNWSWDKILRSPYIKQADILQAFYYLEHEFDDATIERNFDFYEPYTVHESSLSPSIHALIAARLGKKEKAVELYHRSARLDLDNYNNDTKDGLHITSMSGSWLVIVQGFAGMRYMGPEGLSFAPILPDEWTGYQFIINYQGRVLKIRVNQTQVTIDLLQGPSLNLKVYEEDYLVNNQISLTLREE